MSRNVIKIENLSKQYRLGTVGVGTLRGDFERWFARIRSKEDPYLKIGAENRLNNQDGKYVWALKNLCLDVQEGEVLGIIGKNGAGKSTLLKILSKVTGPTTGTVKVKGRIASLLEVGTGFHPELTGRENIFLNGAIMGMKKHEIRSKLDEIIEFAGVKKYIDTPVKRFSSGMYVRLAFSVAAHLESDILVVDEVLAVGDAEFQKRAIGKMKEVSFNQNRTVLFVSHNMGAIKQLCTNGIILENGILKHSDNDIQKLIKKYLNSSSFTEYQSTWTVLDDNAKNKYLVPQKIYFSDCDGNETNGTLLPFEDLFINIILFIEKIDRSLLIGYAIYNEEDQLLFWTYHNDGRNTLLNCGKNHLRSKIPNRLLNEGKYRIELCGGVHNLEWLYKPGQKNPCVYLVVEGNESQSPFWNNKRPTLIAPMIDWTVL